MSPDQEDIRDLAEKFDRALARRDLKAARSWFAPECQLELMGLTLLDPEGAERWLRWLFAIMPLIEIETVTTLNDPPVLFQEQIVRTELPAGERIESRQMRVTVWEGGRIKELRINFDRVDLAPLIARGRLARVLVRRFQQASVARLKA
jgi:hypothetical protein